MASWGRITLSLPITPDIEIRVITPRQLTPEQWARMIELLETIRPGMVADNER